MAVPHYDCLKLKMPTPQRVITMASPTSRTYLYEQEVVTLTAMVVVATKFAQIRYRLLEEASHNTKVNPTTTFHLVDDTNKMIWVNPHDLDRLIRIGVDMSLEMEASCMPFLHENVDVFVCKPFNIASIPRKFAKHCINIKLDAKPLHQYVCCFDEERRNAISDEFAMLLAAGFIKGIKHLDSLANPILSIKRTGSGGMCVYYASLY
jgi:hypothetical protein